jgi:predicted hotdog family 3-hydroxylacyl-ACP dehydratase
MSNDMDVAIGDLLPHKPPMILVDEVVEFREDLIHTRIVIREGIPFFKEGRVPSYVALEYMAQTIGVWSGLKLRQQGKKLQVGFLLGTRRLNLQISFFNERITLNIYGQPKYSDGEMASFYCWVEIEGKTVAEASLNVYQPQSIEQVLAQ